MTGPTTSTTTTTTTRVFATHEPKWQRFMAQTTIPTTTAASAAPASGGQPQEQNKNVYQRQYAHVYHQRLQQLGPRCWKNIPQDDDNNNNDIQKVTRILELEENVESYVVGTLVVQQSAESMDETATNVVVPDDKDLPVLIPGSKCHEKDVLYLEDDSGRVALCLSNGCQDECLTTGVVVAIRGTVTRDGMLQVKKFYPPAPLPQPPSSSLTTTTAPEVSSSSNTADDAAAPHLLLVSGLHCASPHSSSLPRDMLLSFLQGRLNHPLAKNVCRVVVAGGSLAPTVPLVSQKTSKNGCSSGSTTTATTSTVNMVEALRDLDAWLLRLVVAGIPVDILPGKTDPTTANWPQRPLHHSLVQHTSRMIANNDNSNKSSLFYRAPNPYASRHADQLVVGTDGTNVFDLVQRLKISQGKGKSAELLAMEKNIEWGHLCPNGPSTVPTVPHAEKDPMVLEQEQPRLYFAGNCQEFATKEMTCKTPTNGSKQDVAKTRLVCLPAFSETGQAVLVNLNNMKVHVLKFEE